LSPIFVSKPNDSYIKQTEMLFQQSYPYQIPEFCVAKQFVWVQDFTRHCSNAFELSTPEI